MDIESGDAEQLDVRAEGEHRYVATVAAEDGTRREHHVVCPPRLLEQLTLEPQDEPLLVRAALELLLAQPAPMPDRFSLDEAEERHPGFIEELRRRHGR